MIEKEDTVSPLISEKLARAIFVSGLVMSVLIYLSTFVQRGVFVNRTAVTVLMLIAVTALGILCVADKKYRSAPWTLVFSAAATFWTFLLILATGGPKSGFFPLFFLILILAGATSEKGWQVALITSLVCLAYVGHSPFFGEMRDTFRDFFIIRVPVYAIAAYSTYFLVSARLRVSEEKNRLVDLTAALDSRAKQMESLFDLSGRISSDLKVKSVLDTVVENAIMLLSADAATVHMFSECNSHLFVAACLGLSDRESEYLNHLGVGEGVAGWTAVTGEVLILEDAKSDRRFAGYPGDNVASILAVPMTAGQRNIGVLSVYSKEARSFTPEEASLLTTLAGRAAVAEETARLHEHTEQLSLIDDLTGLYNVRKLKAALRDEIVRSRRFGHSFGFIMADIDYFKNYNDTQGHQSGDKVLKKVAELLVNGSRSVDMVFRYGGEEFCLILPETNREEAGEVAERIRRSVESEEFKNGDRQPGGRLTLSLGVAVFPEDTDDGEEIVGLADQMLYAAKRSGRNRVALSGVR